MSISRFILLPVLASSMLLVSCATTKMRPQSSNPVSETEPGSLKTDWGQLKVTYENTTEEGVFFNIELKNESAKPVKYERAYVVLKDAKGQGYLDQQNNLIGKNVVNSLTSGPSLGMLISGAKALTQSFKALGNGDIQPGATHTDRLIYRTDSVKAGDVVLEFTPELVKGGNKNTIAFSWEK